MRLAFGVADGISDLLIKNGRERERFNPQAGNGLDINGLQQVPLLDVDAQKSQKSTFHQEKTKGPAPAWLSELNDTSLKYFRNSTEDPETGPIRLGSRIRQIKII